MEREYKLKPLSFQGKTLKILTQNLNGPCPLLALCNVLLLRGDLKMHFDLQSIAFETLMELLADYLMQRTPPEPSSEFSEQLNNTLTKLPLLQRGLDLNINFTDVFGFESAPEVSVFEMLQVRIVHGWIPEPSDASLAIIERLKTYNNVTDAVVAGDEACVALSAANSSTNDTLQTTATEGLLCSQFLTDTVSQLTRQGLNQLLMRLPENQPCIFFRNNHFSLIIRHPSRGLLTLVTDQGYADEQGCVWETLDVHGDSQYLDSSFSDYIPLISDDHSLPIIPQDQLEDRDLALALSLQESENEQASQQQVPNQNPIRHSAKHTGQSEAHNSHASAGIFSTNTSTESFANLSTDSKKNGSSKCIIQ